MLAARAVRALEGEDVVAGEGGGHIQRAVAEGVAGKFRHQDHHGEGHAKAGVGARELLGDARQGQDACTLAAVLLRKEHAEETPVRDGPGRRVAAQAAVHGQEQAGGDQDGG